MVRQSGRALHWNTTGEPDLVELKITGKCEQPPPGGRFVREGARRPANRGFILASLSRKSPPIIGYATDGPTQCESLLEHCEEKPVHLIRRFGPMFLAAEDADGNLLGNEGLFPVVYPDDTYLNLTRPISYCHDTACRPSFLSSDFHRIGGRKGGVA